MIHSTDRFNAVKAILLMLVVLSTTSAPDSPDRTPLQFLEPVAGQQVQSDEPLQVVFLSSGDWTAALYLDGRLAFSAPVTSGQEVSVSLANLPLGKQVLSLRTIQEGSSGTTFESSEVSITVVGAQGGSGGERRNFSAEEEIDQRWELPVCQDPLGAASEEEAGWWEHDWYCPAACRLRRITQPLMHHCLANKDVLFAGDSLVRHAFVSMAALALESSSYSPSDTHNVEGSGSEDGDGKGARSVSEAVHRAREGDLLTIDDSSLTPEEVEEVRTKCSRKLRYMNHLFCEGKIRTRFDFGSGSSISYYGMWRFHHRNGLFRELYRLAERGETPKLIVLGIGNHELNAARSIGTDNVCPEDCLCAPGFTEWFDTVRTILDGDLIYRHVPTIVMLPSAQNEDLKPADYAWQNNDLVLVFNARAKAVLGHSRSVRWLDTFQLTEGRMHDSVDSIHFGTSTNAMLVQVVLNHFCQPES